MENNESGHKNRRLVLPYKGDRRVHILRSMENYVRKLLSKKSTFQITYVGTKLNSQFNIKDKTNFEQEHDLTCDVNCPI